MRLATISTTPIKEKDIPAYDGGVSTMAERNVVAMQHTKNVIKKYTPEEMEVIKKKFGMQKASEDEIAFCFGVAQQLGLNPLMNQIYFVQRSQKNPDSPNTYIDKFEPMVSRDGLHSIANRTGNFLGMSTSLDLKDSFENKNGKWEKTTDLFATCTVKMMGKYGPVPTEVSVCYSEYVQKTKDGSVTKFWREKPQTMLKKVAESQALRKACDISGVYTVEEMGIGEEVGGKLMLDSNVTETVTEKLEAIFKNLGFRVSNHDNTFYIEGDICGRQAVANLLAKYGFRPVAGEENLFVSNTAYQLVVSGVEIFLEDEAQTFVEAESQATPVDETSSDVQDVFSLLDDGTDEISSTQQKDEESQQEESSQDEDLQGTESPNQKLNEEIEELRRTIHSHGVASQRIERDDSIVVKTISNSYSAKEALKALGMSFKKGATAEQSFWYKSFKI